jgi:hypothetical protein
MNASTSRFHVPSLCGIDGPKCPNGAPRDQLCVAADQSGIVGIGRKIFPVNGEEAYSLLCYDADYCEDHRVVGLASGGSAVLSACYDMFGVADRGNINGFRARSILWMGTDQDQVKSGECVFRDKLGANLTAFRKLLNAVTVGIAAIHYFAGHSTGYWQRHGIASCSAPLNRGFAVGAAHFGALPREPIRRHWQPPECRRST